VARLSGIISGASKLALIRTAIASSMSRSDSNRPRLTLNRLGLARSSDGLIGPDGARSVFGQVMTQLEKAEKQVPGLWLRSKRLFKVERLAGEGLDDAGGGYSEIVSHMMKELSLDLEGKSSLPLLIRTPNGRESVGVNQDGLLFNPNAARPIHLRMFRYLGIWIGVAVRTDSPVDLPLAPAMWELLLGRTMLSGSDPAEADGGQSARPGGGGGGGGGVAWSAAAMSGLAPPLKCPDALAEIDTHAHHEIVRIASLSEAELLANPPSAHFVAANGALFAALADVSGGGNGGGGGGGDGGDACVTPENRALFVRRCIEARCRDEFAVQAAAVRAGMAEVLPLPLLTLLTGAELNNMVCGDPDFEVARLQAAARLEGYSKTSDQMKWLWAVLEGFTPKEKSLFLRFTGGFTRLPHDLAMLPHRFEVHRIRGSHGALPQSATCFFTLKLPEYRTEADLRAKLTLAILNCGAIDTDGRGGDFEQMGAGGQADDGADAARLRAASDAMAGPL
jgi:hypothetical protein